MLVKYTYMYTIFIYKEWKRQLYRVVKKQEHQAEIYTCLWMLISEQDQSAFVRHQATFISYWENKEPQFVSSYKQEYLVRAGTYIIICY